MIIPAPDFKQPPNKDIKTWRYMDYTKFVWMLTSNQLHFPRADRLGDPFEGSWPKPNVEQRTGMFEQLGVKDPEAASGAMSDLARRLRKYIYVSCWHAGVDESAAMWKIYAESGKGIAIQTTFKRLYDVLHAVPRKIFLGKVQYLDYQHDYTPWVGALSPYMRKRKSFEHEQEIRAIIQNAPESWGLSSSDAADEGTEEGLTISVSLHDLIETVYVAPQSPGWFHVLVDRTCRKYDLSKPVRQSTLDEDPFF